MKPPCRKDCPDRSPECHGKCKKNLLYESWKREEYKRREILSNAAVPSETFDRIDRKNRKREARRGRR